MPFSNQPPTLPASDAWRNEDTSSRQTAFFDPQRETHDPHRKGWGAQPLFAILQCGKVCPGQKTRAPSPCWRDSTTKPVKWRVVVKDEAAALIRQLEDYERQTRRPGKQDGDIGRNGLAVFRALIFTFLNYTTGRLDPGYSAIARVACISIRSVARGLAALKAAGVLDWVRRCTARFEAGRAVLDQETNAYGIIPASCWRFYRPTPKQRTAPPPHPDTYGATPPLPDAISAAIIERKEGGTFSGMLRALESDARDELAAVFARMGRAIEARRDAKVSDVPA
jgi:hypothetical protein